MKSRPAIKAFMVDRNGSHRHQTDAAYAGSSYVLKEPGLAALHAMANDPYFQTPPDGAPAR